MAAQDAELKLKVSLDLAFFRQQLAGLGAAAAGTPMPVQIKFDRRSVQNELNALGANIRRRNYRLEINTNLTSEIKKANDLAKALADLERTSKGAGGASARMVPGGMKGAIIDDKTSYKQLQSLYKFAKEANLPFERLTKGAASSAADLRRVLSGAFNNVGSDVKAGISSGLKDANSQLAKLGKDMGESLLKAVKSELGIASPSREFKKIGEDSGEGFEQGLKSGFEEATRMSVQEMRDLFRALQGEAKSGAARLQATMLAAMAGLVQLPGGRQQRGRLAQAAGSINAAMTGAAAVNIGARQAGVRQQAAGAASATPAFMTALPMMFGMSERELMSRLQGLYGQQYRAPSIGGGGAIPSQIGTLISSITGTRGPLGTGGGAISQLFKGGAVNPGVLPSGYIGRSAISPKFVNYPAGMPPAYATGFIEPTAYGSLTAGTVGRYGMGGSAAFPSSPMMRGGIGAGAGSFVPMEAGRSINNFSESLSALTGRVKDAATAVKRRLFPTFGDLRTELIDIRRSVSVAANAQGNRFYGNYMKKSGQIGMYDFPMSGMMGPSTPLGAMGQFPSAGMLYPSSPLGRITAQSSMFGGGGMQPPGGGGGGRGRFGGFGGAMGFGPTPSPIDLGIFQNARLPLTGAISELTSEFANATKQVLLFGTAYKGLAFFMDLPNQAFQAAKALATYKNQLQAVTSESGTFEQSFAFVDNLAQRFNVPLESARQGFVKLYASMQPAGFGQGQIEGLFEGISKATAAFGLSADKVDRVNYAFAQMASKGQIMSEELKGQLGDVLPGALALFAQAAQMSIPEFSKAMEDGAFKGEAMMQVLDNVAILMNSKFGPAAQNASRTLQGALNQMQNNLKLMYESMNPLVNQFASVFGPQVNSLIKDVTSVVNILTGNLIENSDALSTLSPRAEAMYSAFQLIGPAVANAAQNIGNFASSLQVFIGPLLTVTKLTLDFISLPVVARVALYATIIATLNSAFQLLARTGILQATIAMVRFLATLNIAQINVYIAGIRTVVAVLGSMVTAANLARIAMTGLKVVMGGLVVGAIMVGLDMLAQRLLNIGDAANKSKTNVRELLQDLDRMAGSADIAGLTEKYMQANTELAMARKKYEEANKDLQLTKLMPVDQGGSIVDVANAERKATAAYQAVIDATTKLRQVRQSRDLAARRKLEEDLKTAGQLKPVDLSGGDDKTKTATVQSLESLENLRDQLAKARMEGDMERAKILFEYQKRLDERRFELQESGANDVQKAGIKLAKDLFDVKMRLEEQIFNAGQTIMREAGSVAPGNRPPRAPKGQAPYGPITQFGAGVNAGLQVGQQVGGTDMQRPVSGSERRDIIAAEKTAQTTKTETLRLTLALRNAEADYAQTIKQNFDTIFPVAQLRLQNQLLAARYQLELQGVPKEAIDAQMEIADARAKGIEMQQRLDEELKVAIATFDKYTAMQKDGTQLTKEQAYELKNAEAFINAYSMSVGEAASQVKEFTIAQLENAIATMKQADALKALEEVSGRINQAVEGVAGTYKDMFKEIAKGGDSVEALKKLQDALADQALTMFFDFAMQPVEKFFKDQLGAIFGLPNEEEQRQKTISAMEAQLKELQAQKALQVNIDKNVSQMANGGAAGAAPQGALAPDGMTVASESAIAYTGEAVSRLPEAFDSLAESTSAYAEQLGQVDASVWGTASSISGAASEMGPDGPVGSQWQKALGGVVQGLGMAVGSVMGITAGINQIKEGGTSNVLGGIGSIMTSVGGLLGGLSGLGGLFGGGGGANMGGSNYFDPLSGKGVAGPNFGLAKGGIMHGGFTPFRAFANGGIVTGPTMGLVGEGRYSEAVVPLPDGKSIPVTMGRQSSRELLSGNGSKGASSPILSMSFQSTTINGVEYVDRAQLEAAMAETRRLAAREGASQGSQLALSKLKNSPTTRRQLGF